ncbi:MAG: NAD(P)-binding domain-containing protein [Acidobacteriota bacterium]|nr:MAG: NAD(P)-binding domain-containing protein [Acidobacteriota bacterium]
MSRDQIFIPLIILALLLSIGFLTTLPTSYGAVPAAGWIGLAFFAVFIGFTLVLTDSRHRRSMIYRAMAEAELRRSQDLPISAAPATHVSVIDDAGPSYPHPVINVVTCIGCHACVDACPHAVLAIVNGKATTVAVEQCMEDTSCQVECPTVPKSCIVVNTTKKIPERKVPQRDQKFMTNVPGIYLIGDVSGVPLIKNAINEGGAVVDHIIEDLRREGPDGKADFDVAIVGMGPAGLSAAAIARQRGLRFIAIEQDHIAATIRQTYQAGKYVFFNPVDKPVNGGIPLEGAGALKESMIDRWIDIVRSNNLEINEFESCKNVVGEGNLFRIDTEQERTRRSMQYRVRRVIIAIGNRGTPMRLGVPGEDLKITVTPDEPEFPDACEQCGTKRAGIDRFCQNCGSRYQLRPPTPYQDERVKYKLGDPNDYTDRHVVVVGAGNSAVEAAVDLAAYRSEDGTRIVGWRDNHVSLVIRSNFKGDLKLGNKMMVYECIDEGRIKVWFGQTIREITPGFVSLMNAREKNPRTAGETAKFRNDYVFALIGGEKPTKFLESIGIKIG